MVSRTTSNILCVVFILILFGVMFLVWVLASVIYMYNPIADKFPSNLYLIIGFFVGLGVAILFCFLISSRLQ